MDATGNEGDKQMGVTGKKGDTIKERSDRVLIVARGLAGDIKSFIEPQPDKDDGEPTPIRSALDQIAENLTLTEAVLQTARAVFNQLTARIR